jgi:hypothetical protein
MEQMFIRNVDYCTRSNRYSKLNLVCLDIREKLKENNGVSFGVTAARLWNSIPVYRYQDSGTKTLFSILLKELLALTP